MFGNNNINYHCYLEGVSEQQNLRQDLFNKCGVCIELSELQRIRASAKRDLYARSPKGSRLKMTMNGRSMIEMLGVLAIVGVLSVGGIAGYSKAMMQYKVNKTIEQISHMAAAIKMAYMNQKGGVDEYGDPIGKYLDLDAATAIAIGAAPDEVIHGNNLKNVFGDDIVIEPMYTGTNWTWGGGFNIRYDGVPKEACVALMTRNWNGIFQAIAVENKPQAMPSNALLLTDRIHFCEGDAPNYSLSYAQEGLAYATIGCNNEAFMVSPADAALGCTCDGGLCSIAFVSDD